MKDSELINQLSQASEGLLWLSESDYPFETIYGKDVVDIEAKLREVTDCSPDTTIKVRELESFFRRVTEEEDWDEEEEMLICRRYRELVNLLQIHLRDTKVYRVGEIEVNCYILGRTKSGNIIGLSTISVET